MGDYLLANDPEESPKNFKYDIEDDLIDVFEDDILDGNIKDIIEKDADELLERRKDAAPTVNRLKFELEEAK